MGQGSPFFQEEFPKLSAGDGKLEEKSKDKDQGTQDNQYGPGPSLRPQSKFFPFKDFNGEPVLSKAPMIQTLTRFFRNVSDVAKWREGGGHGASQPPPVEGGEATPYEGERSASPSGGSTPSNPGVPPLLARSGMGGGGVPQGDDHARLRVLHLDLPQSVDSAPSQRLRVCVQDASVCTLKTSPCAR